MPTREPVTESSTDADLHDVIWLRWGLGVVGAAMLAGWGVVCIVTQRGVLPGRGLALPVRGGDAVALGLACLAGALLLHVHYYWESRYADHGLATLGKLAGALILAAAMGYLLVRIAWF